MTINPAKQIHDQKEIDAAIEVLKSGHWTSGEKVAQFSSQLAKYVGTKYCHLVNSGSSANLVALMALTTQKISEDQRLKKGDEVITTALCFPTTVSPIVQAGCVPVFVDIDDTWNIDPVEVEKMITDKTKAIMVAHSMGNPFNIDAIQKICEKHELWLIEDGCDSLGSTWDGQKVGSFGDISTCSFYPAHHITSIEGGAVFTSDPHIYRAIQTMVNWGRDCYCTPGVDNTCGRRYKQQFGDLPKGYDHKNVYTEFGYNLKMTDVQAAIGIEQLKKIEGFEKRRKHNHKIIRRVFEDFPDWFELPEKHEKADPSWFGYVVKLSSKAPFTASEFIEYLHLSGIRSRNFFCGNILKQPMFTEKNIEHRAGKLDKTDAMLYDSFWIGCHPGIGFEERVYIRMTIFGFLSKYL